MKTLYLAAPKLKLYIAFISLFFLPLLNGLHAQPCRQINIDSTQKSILNAYIHECILGGFFVDDKGVVVVTRIARSGRPAWRIRVQLDDRYKDNPPVEWAQLDQDVILFYNVGSRENDIEKITATPELLDCLDAAIGDRLYIRPPKRDRWINVTGPNGKTIKVQGRRLFGGSSHNDSVIIFEANGKVTILKSV